VKQLVPDGTTAVAACDGKKANYEIRAEFGANWLYAVVPQGEHTIEMALNEAAE
jgi:hypothetical protein